LNIEAATIDLEAPVRERRIGELLIGKGVVSEDQVRIALTEQRRSGEHLGKILVRLGFVTEAVIRDVLGGALGYDTVDLSKVVVDSEVVQLIPKSVARRFHLLALTLDQTSHTLTVAMSDPYNVIAIDQVRALVGGGVDVRPMIAGATEVDKFIEQFYG
jgi:general secretion pathway protein E/type IV pilus assembly protein PilB